MKKIFPIISLCFLLPLFTSCFDIYQHLSLNPNENTDVYLQFTMSKLLVEAVKNMTGATEDFDYEEWFDSGENTAVIDSLRSFGGKYGKINSELDFGIYTNVSIDYKKIAQPLDEAENPFIPIKKGNKTIINLDLAKTAINSLEDSPRNEMVYVFLSSAKYRLSISKNLVKKISRVSLAQTGDIADIPFSDMNDTYLIEIPLVLLLDNKTIVTIEM